MLLAHSWSQTTSADHSDMILTHPLAFLPLQLAEEKLQLFYCNAVAGEHAQHVYQEVWKKCTPKSIGLTQKYTVITQGTLKQKAWNTVTYCKRELKTIQNFSQMLPNFTCVPNFKKVQLTIITIFIGILVT